MPALPNEMMGLLGRQQAMIYLGELPIRADQQHTVARAFERYKEALETAISPSTAPQAAPSSTPPPSQVSKARPSRTVSGRIHTALSESPGGLTLRQLYARMPSTPQASIQRIVAQQVTAGHHVKEGAKYRLSASPAATPAPTVTTPATASPGSAPRSRSRRATGETTEQLFNIVLQRPGITKAEASLAMAPNRPNHVAIWLNRLTANGRITGGKTGPYYATANAQRLAATG